MVEEIKNNDLGRAASSPFAVIDFNATWCGPCQMLHPVFEECAEAFPDKDFFACDIDQNLKLAEQFGIMSVPSVVIMKNGKPVAVNTGYVPFESLSDFIRSN